MHEETGRLDTDECPDHDFVVITVADDRPVGLACKNCGERWPVGRALPRVYDWQAEGALGA